MCVCLCVAIQVFIGRASNDYVLATLQLWNWIIIRVNNKKTLTLDNNYKSDY